MSTHRPRFINRWFLIWFSISIAGLLGYGIIALNPWARFPPPILGVAIFFSTGLACTFSGVIWVQLYVEQQLSAYCAGCNYNMQAQDKRSPRCPECGNDSTTQYPFTG